MQLAASPSAPSAVAMPKVASGTRLLSIDIFRGLIMVWMALDHTRDFFTNVRFEPEDINLTWPALFFTRWITHFCAPMFFFLAGTGAFLYCNHTGSVGKVSRYLWTRGIWLVILEWTIIEFAWTFVPWTFGGVVWSLGISMVILAALVWLPEWAILTFGLTLVGLHDLFDAVKSEQLGSHGWLWVLLHRRGVVPDINFFVLFPLIPWVGVMASGYVFGRVMVKAPAVRQRILLYLGSTLTLAFVVLRGFNAYGNPTGGVAASTPGEWHLLPATSMTIVYFLDVEKYPPSLQFLLMTVGPSLLLLWWLDRFGHKPFTWKLTNPLLIFGRVPMFFYILHLYVIHLLAIGAAYIFRQPVNWLWHGTFWMNRIPDDYGHNLPFVYVIWLMAVVMLYFPCRWFADLKQRRKDWWLSYL
ncbi:MAG: DUF1624 domain-containing protein [Terriglobales bacterium]